MPDESHCCEVPLTRSLPPPGPYWRFTREERQLVALVFAALLVPGNVERLAELVQWHPPDLGDAEVAVELAYPRDLWASHRAQRGPSLLGQEDFRAAILDCLQLSDDAWLRRCAVTEFNAFFGATPRPSDRFIQYPGRWSIRALTDPGRAHFITDPSELRKVCIYKFAHNAKPDLVILCPGGDVLCIEAKVGSREGSYPIPGQAPASQREVQRFLIDCLLGFRGHFVYLTRDRPSGDSPPAANEMGISWLEVLQALDLSCAAEWVGNWVDDLVGAGEDERSRPDESGPEPREDED